jgi:hypothetical protein
MAKNLTDNLLKKMIIEEKRKLQRAKKVNETLEQDEKYPCDVTPKEIEADEFADSLEQQMNFIKALKIQESKLIKKLQALRETKEEAISRVAKRIRG